jgi:hypothetical protein
VVDVNDDEESTFLKLRMIMVTANVFWYMLELIGILLQKVPGAHEQTPSARSL